MKIPVYKLVEIRKGSPLTLVKDGKICQCPFKGNMQTPVFEQKNNLSIAPEQIEPRMTGMKVSFFNCDNACAKFVIGETSVQLDCGGNASIIPIDDVEYIKED